MTRTRSLHLVLGAGIFAFLIWRAHPADLWEVLGEADYRLLLLTVLLNVPVALLASLRSWFVFGRLGYQIPADPLVPTTVLGFVAGGLTPAATGEILRAEALRNRCGIPFDETVLAVLYERALSAYLLVLTTCVAAAALSLPAGLALAAVGAGVALSLLPWLVAVTFEPFIARERTFSGSLFGRFTSFVFGVLRRLRFLLADLLLLLRFTLVTVAMFAVIAAQYWLLTRSVSGAVSFEGAWLAFGISTLAAIVSLVPFGLGVLDGSLAAVLDGLGMSLEEAGVVVVLIRATVTLPLILGALGCYLYLQRPGAPAARPSPPLAANAAAVQHQGTEHPGDPS